ncbi:hypothetical protein ANCDUO_01692 [Ancylostoma duodenale]|uniref:Uncharacterized protein n=1 Tax=Ancylostoma duodenale TaxID=51022 RepID=A0A0C2DDJ1_9BILA|nr:hypothetical protein ANCDUO_01692 [Ancylostoma duodenale]
MELRYLLPPPPAQRRGLFICRLCTVIGLLLLIGGAVSIVVGYTWPHEGVEQSIYKIVIYEALLQETTVQLHHKAILKELM